MVWGSLRFRISGKSDASVSNAHFFFFSIFFLAGLIFLRAIALALLEGLPTLDPYVPFPYGIIFPFVKRRLMSPVHCRGQFLVDLLKRFVAGLAVARAGQRKSEVVLQSFHLLASVVGYPGRESLLCR